MSPLYKFAGPIVFCAKKSRPSKAGHFFLLQTDNELGDQADQERCEVVAFDTTPATPR
jgi:hypothetical protein